MKGGETDRQTDRGKRQGKSEDKEAKKTVREKAENEREMRNGGNGLKKKRTEIQREREGNRKKPE